MFDFEQEKENSDHLPNKGDGQQEASLQDNGMEFEDLPIEEQNGLIATYNENLKIYDNGKAKSTNTTDKIACHACGAFQSPINMPQHQRSKKCQRIKKAKYTNKDELKQNPTDDKVKN